MAPPSSAAAHYPVASPRRSDGVAGRPAERTLLARASKDVPARLNISPPSRHPRGYGPSPLPRAPPSPCQRPSARCPPSENNFSDRNRRLAMWALHRTSRFTPFRDFLLWSGKSLSAFRAGRTSAPETRDHFRRPVPSRPQVDRIPFHHAPASPTPWPYGDTSNRELSSADAESSRCGSPSRYPIPRTVSTMPGYSFRRRWLTYTSTTRSSGRGG